MKGLIFCSFVFSMMGFPCTLNANSSVQQFMDILELSQRLKEKQDTAIIRPLPQEREAIQELLNISPPPKILIPADRQFLQELWSKVVWTGLERRVMYTIYKEVQGKYLSLTDRTQEMKDE
ncbi:MAG: hypothetical protein WD425_18490 [Nitrospirales bacterium]